MSHLNTFQNVDFGRSSCLENYSECKFRQWRVRRWLVRDACLQEDNQRIAAILNFNEAILTTASTNTRGIIHSDETTTRNHNNDIDTSSFLFKSFKIVLFPVLQVEITPNCPDLLSKMFENHPKKVSFTFYNILISEQQFYFPIKDI